MDISGFPMPDVNAIGKNIVLNLIFIADLKSYFLAGKGLMRERVKFVIALKKSIAILIRLSPNYINQFSRQMVIRRKKMSTVGY